MELLLNISVRFIIFWQSRMTALKLPVLGFPFWLVLNHSNNIVDDKLCKSIQLIGGEENGAKPARQQGYIIDVQFKLTDKNLLMLYRENGEYHKK